MTDQTNPGDRHFPSRATPQNRNPSLTAATLGTGCFLLAAACVGATFWNSDLAVQSGATVLGVSLAASGLISLLAGDQ